VKGAPRRLGQALWTLGTAYLGGCERPGARASGPALDLKPGDALELPHVQMT